MKEQVQTEEFSLLDLVKLLFSKIKWLILVVIIGGIIGGFLGIFATINTNYYGTDLEFYVNPKESISTDSSSQYGVYGSYGRNVMDNMVKLLNSESFAEKLMSGMEDAPTEKYDPKKPGKISSDYKNYLYLIQKSYTVSYLAENDNIDDAANLARSFIYVNISVLGSENEEFANALLVQLRTELPIYVEEKMIVPTGYEGTDCNEITTVSEIGLTNPGHTTKTAIKYGLLAGAAAFVIACIIIIIIDRSDKRLRDYESVAKQLNIPVLGVVPSIGDSNIKVWEESQTEVEK
jgi:capsular polysaccharide biosynthesis protein